MNARVAVQEQPRFDEISEWVEAFDQVLAAEGEDRAAPFGGTPAVEIRRLP